MAAHHQALGFPLDRRTFNRTLAGAIAGAALGGFTGCIQRSAIHSRRLERALPPTESGGMIWIEGYGGEKVKMSRGDLRAPDDMEAFLALTRRGRPCNLRGGGYSFDDQALPPKDGILIQTHALKGAQRIVAGDGMVSAPGNAAWGDVVDRCLETNQIPKCLVTGSGTTVGGTLSSNGLSRHTPIWGKEIKSVVDFDLVTWGGRVVKNVTPDNPLFTAVIGGFGGCGLITRVTYTLEKLPDPVRVRSKVLKFEDLKAFVAALKPVVGNPKATRYGVLYPKADGSFRGIVMETDYCESRMLREYPPYMQWPQCGDNSIKAGYYAKASDPTRIQELRNLAWGTSSTVGHYWDKVIPYTFFQDGHILGKDRLRKEGKHEIITLQQTWVLPKAKLGAFLGSMPGVLDDSTKLVTDSFIPLADTTFVDTFYVPGDDSLLSGSFGLNGYAVTVAFEGPKKSHEAASLAAIEALHERVGKLGGRVHLTKHVLGDETITQSMFDKANLKAFAKIQKKADPKQVWRNPMLARVFPDIFGA